MAELVGAIFTGHSPFACYTPWSRWGAIREARQLRPDVPVDDDAGNEAKATRIRAGFAELRQRLEAIDPDVVVVFGDDQLESFDFRNYPSIAVFAGTEVAGHLDVAVGGTCTSDDDHVSLPCDKALAVEILKGLLERDFDPAFSLETPNRASGIGHAFAPVVASLTDLKTPVVPVVLNCFYAPQITARRCYALGRAVAEIIGRSSLERRVAVVGSGGLWHTPTMPDSYINEVFDRELLRLLEKGDARGMAEYFDAYEVPQEDKSQDLTTRTRGVTGLPGRTGPQGGTREWCNWIAAAAVAEDQQVTMVDYVPVYASPIAIAFGYWSKGEVTLERQSEARA